MENSPAPLMDLVERLLAPVPGDDPTGPSARYDPVMAQIRVAREADDPSLPLGEWERPLKKADWPLVVKLCTHILAERSKDLQVAAWLTEAWIHLHQLDGLRAGTWLIGGLLETYWEGVHPRQDEEGDYEARTAPLAWMNETLPLALRLHVALLPWPDRKPAFISLEDWTQAPLVAPPANDDEADDEAGMASMPSMPSREELNLVGANTGAPMLLQLREQLALAMTEWKALSSLVDNHLGKEAPSMSRVLDTLGLIDRASNSLLSKHVRHTASQAQAQLKNAKLTADNDMPSEHAPEFGTFDLQAHEDLVDSDLRQASGPIRSRADAYRQLEGIANFLQSIEPHSPTPYLIRRAVSWGRMPLPELMQEVLREEGDLNRLFTVLGLKPEQ
jgi:type VI secretion system protein ImpA